MYEGYILQLCNFLMKKKFFSLHCVYICSCSGLHSDNLYTLTCRGCLFTFALHVGWGLSFLFSSLFCEFSTSYICHIHLMRLIQNNFVKNYVLSDCFI